MKTVDMHLQEIRSQHPAWSIFRSDGGAFYATRRELLSFAQIGQGHHQTVCADDMQSFVDLLREQEDLGDL